MITALFVIDASLMFTRRLNLCCFAANSSPEEDVRLIIILMAQQRGFQMEPRGTFGIFFSSSPMRSIKANEQMKLAKKKNRTKQQQQQKQSFLSPTNSICSVQLDSFPHSFTASCPLYHLGNYEVSWSLSFFHQHFPNQVCNLIISMLYSSKWRKPAFQNIHNEPGVS